MKRIALSLILATTAVMATTSLAQAAWATVRRDSDIYRSASSNRVVNEVERGDRVNVVDCDDDEDRCELSGIPGRDGWIDIDDLRPYGKGNGVTFSFGGGGVGISIGGY